MKPLRDQTRWLGSLLGRVLIEQEGKDFFDLVEWVRRTSIQLRKSHRMALEKKLLAKIESLSIERLTKLLRAFTIYFQLVNLAEDRLSVRVLISAHDGVSSIHPKRTSPKAICLRNVSQQGTTKTRPNPLLRQQ